MNRPTGEPDWITGRAHRPVTCLKSQTSPHPIHPPLHTADFCKRVLLSYVFDFDLATCGYCLAPRATPPVLPTTRRMMSIATRSSVCSLNCCTRRMDPCHATYRVPPQMTATTSSKVLPCTCLGRHQQRPWTRTISHVVGQRTWQQPAACGCPRSTTKRMLLADQTKSIPGASL